MEEPSRKISNNTEHRRGTLVAQSARVTRAGYSYTKVQKRFIYEVLRQVSPIYKGVKVERDKFVPMDIGKMVMREYSIPIKDVLLEDDSNYKYLKDSLIELAHKFAVVQNSSGEFRVANFVDSIDIPSGSGIIKARMTASFYEAMADLTRGLTVYDCEVAKNLPSVYAMRMFEFIARRSDEDRRPIRVGLEEMREMMGANLRLGAKGQQIKRLMTRTFDFEKKTLLTARNILNDPKYRSPYIFDFERITEGRKIVGWYIKVSCRRKFLLASERRFAVNKETPNIYFELDDAVISKLKDMGWSLRQIRMNLSVLKAAQGNLDLLATLSELNGQSRNPAVHNRIGYVVEGLKGKLEDAGVDWRQEEDGDPDENSEMHDMLDIARRLSKDEC